MLSPSLNAVGFHQSIQLEGAFEKESTHEDHQGE